MGALTTSAQYQGQAPADTNSKVAAFSCADDELSLMEFHSPAAALAQTPVRAAARGTVWLICSLVAACGATMALVPIDKVVVTQGRVVSRAPLIVVQPLETAMVRSIEVREGEPVLEGQLLARLDPTFAIADQSAVEAQVSSLGTEVARLQAEATGAIYRPTDATPNALLQTALFTQRAAERTARLENYAQRIDAARAQVQRGVVDIRGYEERLRVATELERKRVELERMRVGSQISRLAAMDSRLEMQRSLDNARAQGQGTARDLQALQAEREGYEQQWNARVGQELSEARRKLSDAREQLRKAELRHRLVDLRATQDAIVLNVARVSVGSVLQSGDQLFNLVPLDAPLEVEADLPGNGAGFVHEGDTVTVKFDTFPFVQYGYAEGQVRFVSADSFTTPRNELQARGGMPQSGGTPAIFYRVRITLDAIKLHDTPASFRIVPGMPVTADIKVGKRTVMSYLMGRVLPIALDGMREP